MFNAKTAIFQLYHGENKLHHIMMMMSTLYKTSTLKLDVLVLAHWNNNPPVDISLHVDTLSLMRANKSLFFSP